MAALWYHYFLSLLVNSAVLDAHFFYSNAVFGWDYYYMKATSITMVTITENAYVTVAKSHTH